MRFEGVLSTILLNATAEDKEIMTIVCFTDRQIIMLHESCE